MPTELADRPLRVGRGAAADRMAALDKQVIALSAQQPEVYLANPARARLIPPDGQAPGSVFLVALTHENQHLGCLWLAYEQIHSVSPEEANFVNTLASQITLSITNARLFHEASLGRQRLEAVLAATPDPVLVTDAGNRLLLANPAADQLFGGSRVANQQPFLDELIKQSSLLAILTSVSSDILTGEVIFANLDRVYEASSAPIQLDGQRLGRICVLRDVTEHKKLNTMMSEFVSLVSHDLKNPLTLVKGYATMLGIIGDLTPQQQENLDRIKKGVDRMTVLTDNLLDVTRLEAGVALKIETVSVNKLLADIEEYLQPSARQNRLKLVFAHLTEEIRVEADKSQLRSAWQNLIENAIKYSRQGGQVYVATSLNGDQLLFSVQDNGVGIAPLDQEHVFERFYRVKAADGSTGNIKGNGLGLSIVKSVAERHGGRVWFESQLGKGSRFFLEIPARQAGK
jgi:signal transduction histidine kinase